MEDGPTVLDGHHAPGREGPAVAYAVDLVLHRDTGISRPQEVGVEGVDGAVVVDGSRCRDQRLPGHLTAEDSLAILVGIDAAEDVDLDRLQVQQIDEGVDEGLLHDVSLPALGGESDSTGPTRWW